jgi:hypothetical protein
LFIRSKIFQILSKKRGIHDVTRERIRKDIRIAKKAEIIQHYAVVAKKYNKIVDLLNQMFPRIIPLSDGRNFYNQRKDEFTQLKADIDQLHNEATKLRDQKLSRDCALFQFAYFLLLAELSVT